MITCSVKNCENSAFVAYGSHWVCGKCMVKLLEKEKERKDKQIEELEL